VLSDFRNEDGRSNTKKSVSKPHNESPYNPGIGVEGHSDNQKGDV
jgi:hypothetical protein